MGASASKPAEVKPKKICCACPITKQARDACLPENDEEIEEDPYLLLGYGLNAYFDVLMSAVNMFIVLSVAAIPLFYFYSNNGVNQLAAQGGAAGLVA